jgi:hypothetical protein
LLDLTDATPIYTHGFASEMTITERNRLSLSIPLYVKEVVAEEAKDTRKFADCLDAWKGRRFCTNTVYDELESLLGGEIND